MAHEPRHWRRLLAAVSAAVFTAWLYRRPHSSKPSPSPHTQPDPMPLLLPPPPPFEHTIPRTPDKPLLQEKVRQALGSLQAIVGLNVVAVAFMFLQQWLLANSYYHEFRLESEQAGITTQYLLTRAGISFAALAIILIPTSALIYAREARRKHTQGKLDTLWLLAIIALPCIGVVPYIYSTYSGFQVSAENLLYAGTFFAGPSIAVFLLISGLTREATKRFYGGLILLFIMAMSLLPSAHIQGQIIGERMRNYVEENVFSSRFAVTFSVPIRNFVYVKYGATQEEVAESTCGLFLGSSSGTTYIYGRRITIETPSLVRVSWITMGLPTDSTIIQTCQS